MQISPQSIRLQKSPVNRPKRLVPSKYQAWRHIQTLVLVDDMICNVVQYAFGKKIVR